MNGNLHSDMQIMYNNDIMYIFVQCEREKLVKGTIKQEKVLKEEL